MRSETASLQTPKRVVTPRISPSLLNFFLLPEDECGRTCEINDQAFSLTYSLSLLRPLAPIFCSFLCVFLHRFYILPPGLPSPLFFYLYLPSFHHLVLHTFLILSSLWFPPFLPSSVPLAQQGIVQELLKSPLFHMKEPRSCIAFFSY